MDWKVIDHSSKKDSFFVAGRGFGGLAIAYFLKKRFPKKNVILFDPYPLGQSASGAASGLLEPIGGRLAIRSPLATEGLRATRSLLETVSQFLGKKVFFEGGVLHTPIDQKQRSLFLKKVEEFPDQFGWTQEGELLVKEGVNVFSKAYLEGLFSLVESMGVEFCPVNVPIDSEVKMIFICIGSGIQEILPDQFRLTRGQAMQVKKQNTTFDLPKVHKGYVALDLDPSIYHVGSTYERENLHLPPNKASALHELRERNRELYGEIDHLEVVEIRSGTRVFCRDETRLPKIIRIAPNQIVLSGFGSKGLLYHALYAKKVVEDGCL